MDGKQGCFPKCGSHRSTTIFFTVHLPLQPTTHPVLPIQYLAVGWHLAELGDGLVELSLLLRKVLLVEPKQLLALSVLLLQAWRTKG